GISHTLSDYKGQVILMEFFSNSCTTCREISDFLEKLYQEYKSQGLIIFAVDFDAIKDELSDVQDYAAIYEWTFPVFFDKDGVIPRLYEYNGYLPTCFTIGKDLKIYKAVEKFHDEATYREWIEGALNQQTEEKLTITITTDKINYVMGDEMINAYLELKNPEEEIAVDIAIAILHVQSDTQKTKLWFLPDWSENYHPYRFTLPSGYVFSKTQLLSLDTTQHPFTELGEYILAAAVFEQETINILSLSSVTFNVIETSNQ
ncbi:TlpA family protein disulfide reductase, partial [bacterium]|nr:TlpA family protein disulfide reductase [bacterium]